jgi:hypothetical protein
MQITIDVSEKVAAQAEADGLSVEAFVQRVVERAAIRDAVLDLHRIPPGPYTPQEAGPNLRELSKSLTLGDDVTLKELIHEGHKY